MEMILVTYWIETYADSNIINMHIQIKSNVARSIRDVTHDFVLATRLPDIYINNNL